MRAAISPATVAILVEGIQGEGGVTPATPDYLLGLRQLCDERKLLLLMDSVQDGHFRTGRFQSFQRILEADRSRSDASAPAAKPAPGGGFLPDGISMAKSLGGGFPVGAFWVRAPYSDLLSAGSHGTTFGGSPLACAVALKLLEVIRNENLADNARQLGESLNHGLKNLAQKYPTVIAGARGLGLMIGIELTDNISKLPGDSGKTQAVRFTNLLHAAGLLAIPAGTNVIRFLPALNLRPDQAEEGLQILESVVAKLA
jgi:acetylornithine/succinyldiaminopimelate/putrescine aminotransferase